jgi:serine/threonine protein kinase
VTASALPPTVPGLTGLTVLARGGYATVYRAQQESVGRDVAVKVENRTLETERDRRRFLREARAAGRMSSHPHVVDLFDAGVTDRGHPFLIMELCDGSYAERMRSAPLSPAEVRDVGFKIADALADAHSLGVLHRDVKPANILFSRFGEPALADFGLAILAEWRDVSITLDVLTPAYAPPETFRHSPPAAAADVYALCATLYALMRGRPPRWRADQMPSLLSLVDMFQEQIPDLPGCPDDLMAVLRAGMANDESARPTAIQLRDALIGLRMGPVPPVIVPPLGSPPLEPVYTSVAPLPPPPPPQPGRLLESPFLSGSDPEQTVPHAAGTDPVGGPPPDPARGDVSGAAGSSGAGSSGAGSAGSGPAGSGSSGSGSSGSGSAGAGAFGAGALGAGAFGAGSFVGAPVAPPADPFVGPVRTPPPLGRRGLILAVAGVALVVAALVAVGIAYGLSSNVAGPGPGPSSSSATAPPSSVGASTLPSVACGLGAPPAARCSGVVECYDADRKSVPCTGRHTWESFASGELPKGSQVRDAGTAPVSEVCSRTTLISVEISAGAWDIDVLLPSLADQKAGPTTFRCLAGRRNGAFTGQQLRKP